MKINILLASVFLAFCSFASYAAESHMAQALKHAEAGAKASDAKAITEHAETAKSHVTIAEEHLKAGNTSLDAAIEHGKQFSEEIS